MRRASNNVPFQWNPELQKELGLMKKLSPLDANKKLYTFRKAAVTKGVCYILLQRRVDDDPSKGYLIIPCDSTRFKKGCVGYATFEAKTAAIVFSVTRKSFI